MIVDTFTHKYRLCVRYSFLVDLYLQVLQTNIIDCKLYT